MSELKIDPKLESIRSTATEFVTHEKQTITDFGEKVLHDVEGLINDSVSNASSRLNSMFKRVEDVIKTEPLVVFAALAITGLALVNIMRQRGGKKASAKTPEGPEQHFH